LDRGESHVQYGVVERRHEQRGTADEQRQILLTPRDRDIR